jgi:hypothetical protein
VTAPKCCGAVAVAVARLRSVQGGCGVGKDSSSKGVRSEKSKRSGTGSGIRRALSLVAAHGSDMLRSLARFSD